MEGQITIWDYMKSLEPVQKPDDSVCEGCKWRGYAGRRLEVERLGHTWVYCCPGTACANHMTGTPLNLSVHDKKPYCYNRDFLPPLENLLPLLEGYYDIKFKQKVWNDGDVTWYYTRRKVTVSLDEDTYFEGCGTGGRFIGVSYTNSIGEGHSSPCDNLYEVLKLMDKAISIMEG